MRLGQFFGPVHLPDWKQKASTERRIDGPRVISAHGLARLVPSSVYCQSEGSDLGNFNLA